MTNQGDLIEIEITDLNSDGDGVGRVEDRVVFVPDTVTGDRVLVRLTYIKRQYILGKLHQLIQPSPYRIRPSCIVADKCGGCQWQHIDDEYQRIIKRDRIVRALERIGGFSQPNVAPILTNTSSLGYRNKATYPLGISATGKVQTGYYRRNSHQIINLNQCPVQDPRLNPLLAEIKQDIERRGWTIYDEKQHRGQLRHLSVRIGRRTGEMLLTLISCDRHLQGIQEQAQIWLQRYPQLVGVALNHNPKPTNVIFGSETQTIAGKDYLQENFAGLQLRLRPETFFQVNTEVAEALLNTITEKLDLQGNEILIDAYCGIGTFALPLAKRVKQVIGIEVQQASIEQAQLNAQINEIDNVSFLAGEVKNVLPQLSVKPDIVLVDPPRKGCDRSVIDTLTQIRPPHLVYISCQPATLARDLKLLCLHGNYQLIFSQPADFFPQTSHVECAAFLRQKPTNMI
ncbi:MAG: 23S rRNA (uracil(1939)-C(5))-methyltransferase RlmD [Hydrococcus sp. RU_2_2]|nr:23S rRNA (uracil(1939)-C(5))-methyltransferase RlmD [Hydrococcus sp. RU_2_2]NJP18124.1 23S rRNA (uracil(1939)-C(5))-methyltransferase RlmD [Hydrococcus sp. CRU_1_1]